MEWTKNNYFSFLKYLNLKYIFWWKVGSIILCYIQTKIYWIFFCYEEKHRKYCLVLQRRLLQALTHINSTSTSLLLHKWCFIRVVLRFWCRKIAARYIKQPLQRTRNMSITIRSYFERSRKIPPECFNIRTQTYKCEG